MTNKRQILAGKRPTRVLKNIILVDESEIRALGVMEERLGCKHLNLREAFLDDAGFDQPKEAAQHKVITVDVEISEFQFQVFKKARQLTLSDPENEAKEAEERSNFEKNYSAYTERDYSKAQFDKMNEAFEISRSVALQFNHLLTALAQEIEENPEKAGELEHRLVAMRKVEDEGNADPGNVARFFSLKFRCSQEGQRHEQEN